MKRGGSNIRDINLNEVPIRIDLAGGWSDTVLFTQEHPGYISSLAINATIKRAGSGLAFSAKNNIIKYSEKNNIKDYDIFALIEDIYQKEEKPDLVHLPGRGDICAIVYGGFNCVKHYEDTFYRLEDFDINKSVLNNFANNIVLFSSGYDKNTGDIAESMLSNKLSNNIYLSKKIGECGLAFAENLKKSKFAECANIMSDNWEIQKKFSKQITNAYIDRIYNFAMYNGALGGKLCGAGGGGCFVFYVKDRKFFIKKIEDKFNYGCNIPFEIEYRNLFNI